jgi:hypothetical protein
MKVNICDKQLWKEYLEKLGYLSILTGFLFSFWSIPENYKTCFGICFFILVTIMFFIKLLMANMVKHISLLLNGIKVEIKFGDLFEMGGIKVIPFNEYFDTIVDDKLIAKNTLNGIFIKKHYPQIESLDEEIAIQLKNKPFETNSSRPSGKKIKYKLGTSIEVKNEFVLSAFTHFDDNNNAYLEKSEYLLFLDTFWLELNKLYAARNINVPLIGSGITRLSGNLNNQDFLELILNSIKFSGLKMAHNSKINIILHESARDSINLFKIKNHF